MLVVVDDEDRENEGDLTIAAQFATPEAINFLAAHGRGLISLALTEDELLEAQNVSVLPGSYLAREARGVNPGAGFVRIALVASTAECTEAAHRIAAFLRKK